MAFNALVDILWSSLHRLLCQDHAGLVIDQLDALSEMRGLFKKHTSAHDPMVTMDQAINGEWDVIRLSVVWRTDLSL